MTTDEILASVGLTQSDVERLCKKMEYEQELEKRYSVSQAERARMNEIRYHKEKEQNEIREQQLQSLIGSNFGVIYNDNFESTDPRI